MDDATKTASPAPAVATALRSETPQNSIQTSRNNSTTPPIKTEKPDPSLSESSRPPSQPASSGAKPIHTPTPPSATVEPSTSKAPESSTTPAGPATPANKPLSISIPTTTTGPVVNNSAPAAAPAAASTSTAPFASLAHIFSNHIGTPAISPLSDAGPSTKRSRTPEEGDESSKEKRLKLEHIANDLDKHFPPNQAPADAKMGQNENEAGDSSLADWDLGAQIQNILHLVPEPAGDGANNSTEIGKSDMPPLPPPRPRLEKMKYIENPTYFARAMGLPTLGSLSVQILLALFQQPSEVTDRQIRDVRTEGGKIYTQLRSTFMALLKLFVDSPTFLSADDLDINDPGDRETIQMANLASMCASFYGPGGPTMATAHDNFLKIMIPENGIITQEIAALYLDQKTQSFLAYANVMEDKEATRNSLMEKFFPGDLEDKLRAHWKESNLTDFLSADDFVRPFTDRRHLLKILGHDKEQRKALETKYQFASFLDSLSAFIRSNFDSILDYAESHGVEVPNEAGEEDLMLMHAQSTYAGSYPGQPRRNGDPDTAGLAMLISEKFAGEEGYTYGYGAASAIPESKILPPGQSLPTSVLYERARQAAVAKSSAGARREGLQSTRRPWTPEEEKALMAGLDMVKGPHWSQILQLFGPSGTIKDILKDRTQVQLKDKARNLKLFFLKTNSEMPYYLQCVTGELKTRAPSQAAKKEAEEQARVHAGGPSNGCGYMNGSTNGTGPPAHGQPIAAAPRPGITPPVANSTTPAAVNSSQTPQQQYQQPPHQQQHQQPHQQYQQQQTYQQPRPQQLQPAPNGAARSPAPPGHHPSPQATKPAGTHQAIAPAPSYQRPLQQAGAAPASQYQQRPAQQPTGQAMPTTYQQATRTAAQPPSNNLPARATCASTTPQPHSRAAAPGGPGATAAPRPIQAASTAPPRPTSTRPVNSTPSPAPGQGLRGVLPPHNPARTLTPAGAAGAAGATGPPRPANQPPVAAGGPPGPTRPTQPSPAPAAMAPGPGRPVQQPTAQSPRPPQQATVAKSTAPAPAVQQPPTQPQHSRPLPAAQPTSTPASQPPIPQQTSLPPATPSQPALSEQQPAAPTPSSQPAMPQQRPAAPTPPSQPVMPQQASAAPAPSSKMAVPQQASAAPALPYNISPAPVAHPPSKAAAVPVPAASLTAPDKVESNVEVLGQSMKKESFV